MIHQTDKIRAHLHLTFNAMSDIKRKMLIKRSFPFRETRLFFRFLWEITNSLVNYTGSKLFRSWPVIVTTGVSFVAWDRVVCTRSRVNTVWHLFYNSFLLFLRRAALVNVVNYCGIMFACLPAFKCRWVWSKIFGKAKMFCIQDFGGFSNMKMKN